MWKQSHSFAKPTVIDPVLADHRCSRTYSPPEDKEALSQICRNDVCRCTQGEALPPHPPFFHLPLALFACNLMYCITCKYYYYITSYLISSICVYYKKIRLQCLGDCCVSKSDSETIPVNNRTTQACESLHYGTV